MLIAAEKKVYHDPEMAADPGVLNRRRAGRSKNGLYFICFVVTIFAFGVYYTSLSAVIARKGYQLEKLEKEISCIETENERLELTLASMSSLDKVEKMAVEKLGMKKPGDADTVFIAAADVSAEKSGGKLTDNLPKKDEKPDLNSIYEAFVGFFKLGEARASSGAE